MGHIAAFIDFQGTLGGSGVDDITTLNFYPFSISAIKKLNINGILIIGITNQSRISKGEFTWDEYLEKLHRLKEALSSSNAYFYAVYCCPHQREDSCGCKKPKTGMIDTALSNFDIDIKNSFVVGDMGMPDMVLAKNIGAKSILVLTGVGKCSLYEYKSTWQDIEPNFVAKDLLDAVNHILLYS